MPFVLLLLPLLVGCSASRYADAVSASEPADSLPGSAERATLSHFIDAATYDAREEYASAILEYQDALQTSRDPAIYLAISRDYSRLGKHALASQFGRRAVDADPLNKEYRLNLAGVYIAAFQSDSALVQYEALLRLDSLDTQGLYGLARLYEGTKPLEAVKLYHRLLRVAEPAWEVYYRLARLYDKLGLPREECDVYRSMLGLDPANADLKRALADKLVELKDYDSALVYLKEILQTEPNEIDILGRIAEIKLLKGEFTGARTFFERLLAQDSLSAGARVHVGEVFLAQAQKDSTILPEARRVFDALKKKYPEDWRPYWYLGAIGLILRQDSVALTNFRHVTRLTPGNAEAWSYIGSIELDMNHASQAATALQRSDSLKPQTFRTLFLLGVAYSRAGDNAAASGVLEHAVRLDSTNVDAWGMLGMVNDELHDSTRSDGAYERALKIDPHNHLILNNYGYALSERGRNLARALTMSEEAVAAQPDNTSYLDTLGWIYFKLGDYQRAREYIGKAISKGDASGTVIAHMGDVCSKLGEHEKAIEHWKKALSLDPNDTSLKTKIEHAEARR